MKAIKMFLALFAALSLTACATTAAAPQQNAVVAAETEQKEEVAAPDASVSSNPEPSSQKERGEEVDDADRRREGVVPIPRRDDTPDEQAERSERADEADREREKREQEKREQEDRERELASAAGTYVFTSGLGAWETRFQLEEDGTFSGNYSDEDWGTSGTLETGEDYEGTIYKRSFSGRFSIGEKLGDNSYELILEEYSIEGENGEEWLEPYDEYDDRGQARYYRVVNSPAYALEGYDSFILYEPPLEKDELPWAPWDFYDYEEKEAFCIGFGLEDEMDGACLRIERGEPEEAQNAEPEGEYEPDGESDGEGGDYVIDGVMFLRTI